MKNLFISAVLILLMVSCASNEKYFGEKITSDDAQEASVIKNELKDKDSIELKLTGTIEAVCQVKGCWMTVDIGNGEKMRVKFKDYGFFVPKKSKGKTTVVEGWAYKETLSVKAQQHLAEDDGASDEEIAAITKPVTEYTFMAKGVIIK